MNILLINQPLNNRGDESAHKAFLRNLYTKLPEANINVLFTNANNNSISQFNVQLPRITYTNISTTKGYYKIFYWGLRYNISSLWKLHPSIRKIVALYNKADYIICAPGGICMGGFQNWEHLFLLKLAKITKKPLVYYGRSFGPFPTITHKNRSFKKISLEMLNYISFLSIRDKKTEELSNQLHIPYYKTVDSAFLDNTRPIIPNEIADLIGRNKYMIFVPNLLIWHYAYKNRISKQTIIHFYRQIISMVEELYPNLNIIMLPQTFNYENKNKGDINFFYELTENLNDSRIIIISDQYNSDIQQSIISNAEFLIGARYHSIVFAINNSIPFIALSYEHKISGLLTSLSKEECIIDISRISDSCKENNKLLDNIKEKMCNLKKDTATTSKAKEIASSCFNKLIDYLISHINN